MRLLAETRTELDRVAAERDQLRQQLARVDGLQAATVALSEDDVEEPGIHHAPASMEDLVAALSSIEEAHTEHDPRRFVTHVPADEESQEMIAPEIVFPEEYGRANGDAAKPEAPDAANAAAPARPAPRDRNGAAVARVLVFLDDEQPIKYPLYKRVMTIGRSGQADIQVAGDFISRVHARIVSTETGVVVEDVDSKNGIRVNSKPITRHALRHGDVIGLGKLRFTFVDTAAE
jgi:hypothetical protein